MKEKLNQILNSFKEEISLVDSLDYIDFKNLEKGIRISRAHLQKLRFLLREEKFESEGIVDVLTHCFCSLCRLN